MIRTRQHWMVLVNGKTLLFVALAFFLFWLYFNPRILVQTIHLSRTDAYYPYIHFFYDHGPLLAILPLVGAGVSFFLAWSWWSISFFSVDDRFLTYEIKPLMSNSIPVRAIQDIRIVKPWMGMMFGYGTLIVDAGRQEESLLYVPHVEDFLHVLAEAR
jgi:hypothetical protein